MHIEQRAFTLVEMAIVLVIIGLIAGMAIKGKSLIHSARVTKEVAKLNKFEAAVASYVAETGQRLPYHTVPGSSITTTVLDHRPLIEMGLISESERRNYFVPEASSGTLVYKWSFFRCSAIRGSTFENDGGICVGVASTVGKEGAEGWGLAISDVTRLTNELICAVEVIKDNKNVTTGAGRMPPTQPDVAYFADEAAFDDCAILPWDNLRDNLYLTYNSYVYRVF